MSSLLAGTGGYILGQRTQPISTVTATITQTLRETTVAATQPRKQTITIGEVPVFAIAPLYIALEKDLFSKEGLEPQLKPIPAGSGPSIEAILSRSVDVSSVDYASVMKLAEARGIYLKVVHNLYAVGDYRG